MAVALVDGPHPPPLSVLRRSPPASNTLHGVKPNEAENLGIGIAFSESRHSHRLEFTPIIVNNRPPKVIAFFRVIA